jgi:AraC-like DNA-binding protein
VNHSARKINTSLEIRVPIGTLLMEVFYINYEAAVPAWGFGNHAHSSYELHFVSSGRGTLRVGDKKFAIVPGTFYLTGPGVYHEQKADRRDPMNEYCLNFDLIVGKPSNRKNKSYLPIEVDEIAQTFAATTFWFGHDTSRSAELFERVFDELETRRMGHYTSIQNWLSLIILNALRCFVGNRQTRAVIPERQVTDSRRLLIDHYFQALDRPRSRRELASILGTSVRHLNRILADIYSLSFREKLVRSRLDLAADLLRNSELPIAEVSARLGFARQAYFSRSFRTRFGIAPSLYRREGAR